MEQINYSAVFVRLTRNIELFLEEFDKKEKELLATELWSVKEILCHLVFWHENYAANYDAMVKGVTPPLFDKTANHLNIDGVESLKNVPVKELRERLLKANDILRYCIVEKMIPQMTYTKRGRTYDTLYFVEMIAGHFATHTKQVKRAKWRAVNSGK